MVCCTEANFCSAAPSADSEGLGIEESEAIPDNFDSASFSWGDQSFSTGKHIHHRYSEISSPDMTNAVQREYKSPSSSSDTRRRILRTLNRGRMKSWFR
jgi:hypothetical protein